MTTRMESATEGIALTVLRKIGSDQNLLIQPDRLREAFQAIWPIPSSNTPMNDALAAAAQAASNCAGQDGETGQDEKTWKTTVSQAWQPALKEVTREYLRTAKENFRKGELAQGAETLTDAVRATLGYIAAARGWPHRTDEDLHMAATALASGQGWPETMEELDDALDNMSEEGKHLNASLGASMGLPDSIAFGTYTGDPDDAEENGFLFAETVMALAEKLAGATNP